MLTHLQTLDARAEKGADGGEVLVPDVGEHRVLVRQLQLDPVHQGAGGVGAKVDRAASDLEDLGQNGLVGHGREQAGEEVDLAVEEEEVVDRARLLVGLGRVEALVEVEDGLGVGADGDGVGAEVTVEQFQAL